MCPSVSVTSETSVTRHSVFFAAKVSRMAISTSSFMAVLLLLMLTPPGIGCRAAVRRSWDMRSLPQFLPKSLYHMRQEQAPYLILCEMDMDRDSLLVNLDDAGNLCILAHHSFLSFRHSSTLLPFPAILSCSGRLCYPTSTGESVPCAGLADYPLRLLVEGFLQSAECIDESSNRQCNMVPFQIHGYVLLSLKNAKRTGTMRTSP